jgi:hypothetical protein
MSPVRLAMAQNQMLADQNQTRAGESMATCRLQARGAQRTGLVEDFFNSWYMRLCVWGSKARAECAARPSPGAATKGAPRPKGFAYGS